MKILVVNLKKTLLFAVCPILALAFFASAFVVNINYKDAIYIGTNGEINAEKLVIIDPGHGGEDPGAVGVNGSLEKDLNLEISLLVGEELVKSGYTVIYTRTEDKLLYKPEENIKGIRKISDLKNRCKIAEEYPSATFVSIHMNSFAQEKYSGMQVYSALKNADSRLLAEKIQKSVKTSLQPENKRVVKEGRGIYILENVSNKAVLIECGFLSNSEECAKLSEKEYQKQLSFSIVCGIIEYDKAIN